MEGLLFVRHSDIAADDLELTYLKVQLKALEVQATPYIPLHNDNDLADAIRRWKLDWADVDARFRERRINEIREDHGRVDLG